MNRFLMAKLNEKQRFSLKQWSTQQKLSVTLKETIGVTFTTGAVLRIKRSKNLQYKEGILLIQLPNVLNSILCQLSASQHLILSHGSLFPNCTVLLSAGHIYGFITILLNPQAPRLPYRSRPGGLLTTQLQMQRSDLRLSSPRS